MRILLVSDMPTVNTGYGVAAYNLGKFFRRAGHDVGYLGFQHQGSPAYVKVDSEYLPIYEGMTTVGHERSFREFKPQVAIHIRDAFAHSQRWFQTPYSFMQIPNRPKIILYTPVQSDNLPQEFVDACIRECDLCVTSTQWSKEVLVFQGVPFNKVDYVPFGYDPEVYKPINIRKEEYGFSPNRPVIGSVGVADQYRKGWPLLIKAVSIVKRSMDVELYLHTAPDGHYTLPHHGARLGMKGAIGFPARFSKTWGVEAEKMAALYNSMSLYVSTSMGEGFNVPCLEALACGTAVVCTDMPNHREVLGEHAFYAPAKQIYPTAWSFEWLVDAEELPKLIMKVLSMPVEDAKKHTDAQLEYVKKFSWERVVEEWLQVIEKHKGELGV